MGEKVFHGIFGTGRQLPFAQFVLIPSMIAVIGVEAVFCAPDDWKSSIRHAIQRGAITRGYAFRAGFITGAGVLALCVCLYLMAEVTHFGQVTVPGKSDSKAFLVILLIPIFTIAFSPHISGS